MQESGAFYLFKILTEYFKMDYLNIDYNVFPVLKISKSFTKLITTTYLQTLTVNYTKIGDEGGILIG